MKINKVALTVILALSTTQFTTGQTSQQVKIDSLHAKLSNSPIVSKYYDQNELDDFKSNSPKQLLKIDVKFFYSYKIDTINNNVNDADIKPRLERFIENFDINKYSKKRDPNQRVELFFEKYGVKLTLFRDDEIQAIMQQIIDENN